MAGEDGGDDLGDFGGVVLEVGVLHDEDFAGGEFERLGNCRGLAAILVGLVEADFRLAGGEGADDLGGAVLRAVVDDDDFLDDWPEFQHAAEDVVDGALLVVNRDEHRERAGGGGGLVGHGGRGGSGEGGRGHAWLAAFGNRSRNTLAGTPAATTLAGKGLVTTDPAPTTVPGPTSARTIAALPTHAPAPMVTTLRLPPCSRIGTAGSSKAWVTLPLGM